MLKVRAPPTPPRPHQECVVKYVSAALSRSRVMMLLLLLTKDCAEVSLPGHSGPNMPRRAPLCKRLLLAGFASSEKPLLMM